MRSPRIQLLVSIAIGAGLVIAVLRQIDIGLTLGAIARTRILPLTIGLGLMIAAYACRAGRWLIWDRSLGYAESARAILVGFMGNNVLPARLGEILRADWTAAASRERNGRTAALASIAAERVLDGAALSVLAVLSLAVFPVGRAVFAAVVGISAAFGVLLCVLVGTLTCEPGLRKLVHAVNSRFPGHLTRFATAKLHYAIDGVLRLRGAARFASAVAATLTVWLLEVAFYYSLTSAIWPVSIAAVVLLVTVVNFASLFPLTVGGVGAIEGAATAFLVSVGVPADRALAIVLVQHASQLVFTTGLGGLAYFTAPRFRRASRLMPGLPAQPENVLDRTREILDALTQSLPLQAPDSKTVLLSVVIPAYNERLRLPRTALDTIEWCHTHSVSYEILIVDDGSSDDTLEIARLLERHDRNVKTLSCPHRGKGAAVRLGMLNARGEYVLFMDADGATPLSEISRLLHALENGADVVIGSRVLQVPGEVVVETSAHRRVIGRAFAFLVNLIAVSGIADTQCGFKIFRRRVVKSIFGRQRLDGFAFDVEILWIARSLGIPIAEVPVNWQSQPGSKVNLVTDSLRMLRDIVRVRWMHRGLQLMPCSANFGLEELPPTAIRHR